MRILSFILVLLTIACSSVSAGGVTFINFEKGGYEKAKVRANQEGKLLFLDFYATWCTPCKWMEETTFADTRIVQSLNQDFIAVKVNIDDFEGFELKEKYSVRYLPTFMIFDLDGNMVERVEETLSPSKMGAILSRYKSNAAPNSNATTAIRHQANTSPDEVTKPSTYNPPVAQEQPSELRASSDYRMQMGVFSSIDGASAKVRQLEEIFLEDIRIIEDQRTGSVLYKVVMGKFGSMSEAESFRKILREKHKMDSIIY